MKAEIITTGTEIMLGDLVNTNSAFLSKRLKEMGVETLYHTSTDDAKEHIYEVFEVALKRVDLIIFTGGLGPTDDDLTKFVVADYLNLPCYLDPIELERIDSLFKYRGYQMTDNNKKQAVIPKGATWLTNDYGSASGVLIHYKNKTVVMLPGPPHEMKHLFEKYANDFIRSKETILTETILTTGLGESDLETRLLELNFPEKVNVTTLAKSNGIIEINLLLKTFHVDGDKAKMSKASNTIHRHLKPYIFGYDDDTIENYVIRELTGMSKTLAIVESCTGGMITSQLVKIPGASEVLLEGLVAYSIHSKANNLNYDEKILSEYGVYSEEFSIEMAKKMKAKTQADIVVATTGVTTADEEAPEIKPGTLFITVMSDDLKLTKTYQVRGDRETVLRRMMTRSLGLLKTLIYKIKEENID